MKKIVDQVSALIKTVLTNGEVNGAITVIGFIGYLLGDSIAKTLCLLIAVVFGILFLKKRYRVILSYCRKLLKFLTWKFFIGAIVGTFLGVTLLPIAVLPLVDSALSIVAPEIVVWSIEPRGNYQMDVNHPVIVQFNDSLPSIYEKRLKVEISPEYKIKDDMRGNWLYIEPAQSYTGFIGERFEYDTHYTVTVSVPGLEDSIEINFCTPKKGERIGNSTIECELPE